MRYRRQSAMAGHKFGPDTKHQAGRQKMVTVVADVRRLFPHIKIGSAFVHTEDRVLWHFRGPDKFRCDVYAENAYEARGLGWIEWMKHMGVPGYVDKVIVSS